MRAPERASGKRKVASDIKILNMATDRLKDAIAASLRLTEDGQNLCLIPAWMDVPELIEFTAERRTESGWEKRPGMVRNESFDHLVQARALHIIIGAEKIEWSAPAKSWVMLSADNEFAVPDAGQQDGKPKQVDATLDRKAVAHPPQSHGGWLNKRREKWL